MIASVFLFVFAISAAKDAAQQETPPSVAVPPFRLSTTTRLVTLDVVVLDKAGNPVPNLDRSQFSITEDGLTQGIRDFDATHTAPPGRPLTPIEGTSALSGSGAALVDILIVDELNSKFEDMAYARAQMEKFLLRQPELLPVPMQLLAAGDSRFVVLHDYTQSRTELLDSLRIHTPQYPWQMMRNASGDGALERMAQTLGILGQIADASGGTPARKNVVWVGAGYPSVDTSGFNDEDQDKMLAVIKTATARMQASRVVLYIVDPAGVHGQLQEDTSVDGTSPTGTAGAGLGPFAGKLEFTAFAAATGGDVFAERNDLDIAIQTGLRNGSMFYTLSYIPTNASEASAAYRKIRVLMKDKSLHAITREGYFPGPLRVEPPPANEQKASGQLRFDLAAAAQTTLVYNGLDVEAAPVANGYQLNIAARDLTWIDQPDTTRRAEVTVMAVCYNEKSKQLSHESRELTESIRATDSIEHGERAGFAFTLSIPKGTVRIRFVARDAGSGKIGSLDLAR